MSVDTRTPRFDDQPSLSMVKVPCDPAQVIVNHASFRVRLAPAPRPKSATAPRTPVLGTTGAAAGTRRRTPVVWSGKAGPGGAAATGGLLQAVREADQARALREDAGATQVIPRVDLFQDTMPTPAVIGQQRGHRDDDTQLLAPVRDTPPRPTGPGPYGGGTYDGYDSGYRAAPHGDGTAYTDEEIAAELAAARRQSSEPSVRHGYYPDRRMNLGVVLLPLRVFLGFISIYAGMGKLCDPVYFDGGERGSMVTWLHTLHPWALAEPLRDFALAHPVGAGLSVAFLQVIVGVLTVFGLWQRFAAGIGALLSAALLMTVSWKTVPAYDAPDIIYLAAWSPLLIAGAPIYSIDGRLTGEAWRTLGPRSTLWELRRRVLRRGTLVATVVVGLTLLIGSVLGGAVRSATVVTVPGPGDAPSNYLPGSPLPTEPGAKPRKRVRPKASGSPSAEPSKTPEHHRTTPAARETATVGAESPTATAGTGRHRTKAPRTSAPHTPAGSGGPSASGGSSTGGSSSGGGGSTEPEKPGGGSGGGGLVGGLLG
ncbi:DoxX family protein [Streptomyces sp. NPDC093225]|uniref:DoxX family protein n=1 Tax=Streptomyces sp. NPDC093225 TaxID=3366034 RepID=UPI0038281B65